MIGRIGGTAGNELIVHASGKRTQAALKAALESGLICGLGAGQKYVAAEPEHLSSALPLAQNNDAIPLLLLDGPTPVTAKRVPASLVILPLNELDISGDIAVQELAKEVYSLISSKAEIEDPSCRRHKARRSSALACEKSGEPESLTVGVKAFEALWNGLGSEGDYENFWHFFGVVCERASGSLDDLLDLILCRYCAWFSPYSDDPIKPAEAFAIFETVQENWLNNEKISHCVGAQYWNHPAINATFTGKNGDVSFHETQESALDAAAMDGGQILSWAGKTDSSFENACKSRSVPLLRIEDGFLRSVGLGAGLARGAMLAVDDLGIYYDPSRPSRLEKLLSDCELSDTEIERGKSLIELIKAARVSKYNFGDTRAYSFPLDKKTILVPGQVADDAAIRKSRSGTIDCANTPNVNIDLLKLVRARHPEAYLVFKPHPDVETGLRKGKIDRSAALEIADVVAEDANIIDLIEVVDVVETFSSLSGFEALLRGKHVIVHGAPFYAGWGLTEDLTEIEGRTRNRTLAELVYLALVKYARTIDPVSLLPCTPEFLVSRLVEQRTDKKHLLLTAIKRHSSWLGRKLGI
ncbi:Capsule polysaccharide biosynthesis protein [Roseibium album]|nr:Capsule polysaccharide biosynthesis protein [Roseibium album]